MSELRGSALLWERSSALTGDEADLLGWSVNWLEELVEWWSVVTRAVL